METQIEKELEKSIQEKQQESVILYNPEGTNYANSLSVARIELNDDFTRIDFLYKSPNHYINGGWVQMHDCAFIRPVGSEQRHRLVQAINIPIAPQKHYFKRCGEHLRYTLLFPALPKSTRKIDIIEKEAAGTYFNFYNVDFAKWMIIPHASYQKRSCN